MTRRRDRGFTLLELLLTLVIVATALVALEASVSTGIAAAGDSINQRAAREIARAKLEEAIATQQTTGGGPIDGYPSFQWSLTSEEKTTGASDSPTEKYVVLTVTVSFPQDNPPPQAATSTGGFTQPTYTGSSSNTGGQITLTTMVDPPDLAKNGPSSQGGK